MQKIYNVLIAENDYIIKNLLDNHNHLFQNIFFVDSVAETISLLKRYDIDIAILDLDIPHADAFEVLRLIEVHTRVKTKIIVFSHRTDNYFLSKKDISIYNKPLNVIEIKNLIDTVCRIIEEDNEAK